MPTSDPAKRRIQNRDNQKKFRQRQIRQLADLSDAFSAQSNHLAEVKGELQRLRLAHCKATSYITRLRRKNARLENYVAASSKMPMGLQEENSEPSQVEISVRHSLAPSLIRSPESSREASTLSLERHDLHSSGDCASVSSILDTNTTSSGVTHAANIVQTNTLVAENLINDTEHDHSGFDSPEQVQQTTNNSYDGLVPGSLPHSGAAIFSESPQVIDEELVGTSIAFDSPRQDYETESECTRVADAPQLQDVPFETPWTFDGQNALVRDGPSEGSESHVEGSGSQLQDMSLSCDLLFENHHHFNIDAMQSFDAIPFTSRISKHIVVARSLLMDQLIGTRKSDMDHNAINYAFSWMLRQAWPTSANCLKLMGVYQQLFNYELWRNFPCRATYYNIHPLYRPTPIQLAVPHAPAIDWLPWPKLREKAIEFQSSLDIDLLNMTALKCTVIERRPYISVDPQQSMDVTTFRAWDVYLLEKNAGISFSDTSLVHQPQSLSVRALLQAYNIRVADLTYFRLDKAFFDVFPMLWSPEVASCCKTMPLRYSDLETLDYPSDLDPQSLTALKLSLQYAYATEGF